MDARLSARAPKGGERVISKKKTGMRLGVYGGTFNPPHVGHVTSAVDFLSEMRLDKLLVIPDYIPPHKAADDSVSSDDRLEMTRRAFAGIDGCEVSDMEIRRGGTSFTSDTLAELAKDGTELFLLVGTDMFLTLDTWHAPEEIFRFATVCFVRRESDPAATALIGAKTKEYEERFAARIHPITSHEVTEISSTDLRDRLHRRAGLTGLLPASVLSYVTERGLYL